MSYARNRHPSHELKDSYRDNYRGGASSYRPSYQSNKLDGYGSGRPSSRNDEHNDRQRKLNFQRNPKPAARNDKQTLQLWMGDLEPLWDEDMIIKIWNGLGEAPLSVKLIRDRNGSKKPLYCFVNFANEAAVASAFLKNGSLVPGTGRKLKLNYATGSSANEKFRSTQDDFSLMVSGLDPEITESQIFEVLNTKFPNSVRQVKLMVDPTTGGSRGFGFVKFNSSATQQIALKEMATFTVQGKSAQLSVSSNTKNPELANSTVDLSTIHLPQAQPKLSKTTDPYNTVLEVRGLAGRVSEADLEDYFLSFGDIISLLLTRDSTGCSIRYRFREDAETAFLYMNRTKVNGTELSVSWGEPFVTSSINSKLKERASIPTYYGTAEATRFDTLDPSEIALYKQLVHEMSEPALSLYISYLN